MLLGTLYSNIGKKKNINIYKYLWCLAISISIFMLFESIL